MIESMRIRWARHVTCMGEMRNVHKVLVYKISVTEAEGKRPPGRPRRR
jgi:hypothetical protein